MDGTQARLKQLEAFPTEGVHDVERVDGTQARLKLAYFLGSLGPKEAWKGWMGLRRD